MFQRTTIHHLPNEILSEIARYLPVRHGRHVVDCAHVASFSSTSRRLRAVGLSHLLREVTIISVPQLQSFCRSLTPKNMARYLQELNLFMDEAFLEAWITFSAVEHLHDAQSPYRPLVHILAHSNHLQALRIRVAEPSGARTAWRKFGLARAGGIFLGRALDAVWPTFLRKNILSNLRILEMDGFQDVEPLVRLAPHLRYLRMALSAGYSQTVNDEIVQTLRCVPELRHFSYTPDTLRLTNAHDNNSSVGLLLAISKSLPCLETLDLQTRYHRHSIYLCSSSQQLVQEELIAALSMMPSLLSIALPSSTMSRKDFHTLRTPLPISAPENALEQLPHLREALKSRSAALLKTGIAEIETVQQAGHASSNLQEVVFTRNVEADDCMEYGVRYVLASNKNNNGRQDPSDHGGYGRITGFRLDLSQKPEIVPADIDQTHCASLLPHIPPASLALVLRQLWAPPANRRLRTLTAAWAMIPIYPADLLTADIKRPLKQERSMIGPLAF